MVTTIFDNFEFYENYKNYLNYLNHSNSKIQIISQSSNELTKLFFHKITVEIIQLPKNIQFKINKLYTFNEVRYVDIDLKKAFKHWYIMTSFEYLKSLNFKELSMKDLGLFSNLFLLRSITSASSITLFDLKKNNFSEVETTFICNKQLLGYLANQYLSHCSFIFDVSTINKITNFYDIEKFVNFDSKFYMDFLNNLDIHVNNFIEVSKFFDKTSVFEKTIVNKEFIKILADYGSFFDSEIIQSLKSNHTYQILYNLKYSYNNIVKQYTWEFDSLCFTNKDMEKFNMHDFSNIPSLTSQIEKYLKTGDIKQINLSKINICSLFLINFLKNVNEKKNLYIDKTDVKTLFNDLIIKSKHNNIKLICFDFDFDFDNSMLVDFFKKDENLVSFIYFKKHNFKNLEKNYIFFFYNNYKLDESFFDTYNKNHNAKIYTNLIEVIEIITTNFDYENFNFYNIIVFWKKNHQNIVSPIIDLATGGLIIFIPTHWNCI